MVKHKCTGVDEEFSLNLTPTVTKKIARDQRDSMRSKHMPYAQVTMAVRYNGLSHCKIALVFAVLMDLMGATALLLGVFAPLEIKGRDFGDLLVYSGALLVLMSLGGWVMWYSGNIEGLTSRKELGHIGTAVDRLARTLSRRIRTHRVHTGA
ncbi:transmembrane protein 238a [Anguilla anguilla]|uniref:transmembrane protein 238a n=1 Tax=Anguilla anguilla TaxID=7936 RepID=UPI0015AF8FD5|nr:transmembrane protein 238a [Anguilla anguilla]